MLAKANTPYPISAFSGLEYVRNEWREVPKGLEEEARGNPFLELKDSEPEPEPGPDLDPLSLVEVEAVEVKLPGATKPKPAETNVPTKRNRGG